MKKAGEKFIRPRFLLPKRRSSPGCFSLTLAVAWGMVSKIPLHLLQGDFPPQGLRSLETMGSLSGFPDKRIRS